jgi:hypothetical protein
MNLEDFYAKKKIDYERPSFTLDMNVVAVKDRSGWGPELVGLTPLEYNYFHNNPVELCVTPETTNEILQGQPLDCIGTLAYQRFMKSELFKSRPQDYILELNEQQSNQLWMDIRGILFPSVTDPLLNENQKADITQMFYHCTASGSLENSAFLTQDQNFHRHAGELYGKFGIQVMYPTQAWDKYREPYDLYKPTDEEVVSFMQSHDEFLTKLRS